jgi:hypothetical protein
MKLNTLKIVYLCLLQTYMLAILKNLIDHLNLLASLSHSINSKVSPILTGPFTFLIKVLFGSYPIINYTLT